MARVLAVGVNEGVLNEIERIACAFEHFKYRCNILFPANAIGCAVETKFSGRCLNRVVLHDTCPVIGIGQNREAVHIVAEARARKLHGRSILAVSQREQTEAIVSLIGKLHEAKAKLAARSAEPLAAAVGTVAR